MSRSSAVLVVFGLALVGCTPYMSAGYDAHSSIKGPIANMVTQPAATARDESGTAAPVEDTRSYSFAIGGGGKRLGLEVGAHLHDVKGASFSLPGAMGVDPTSPRYLFATTSVDFRFRWILSRFFVSDMHIGPAGGFVLDRGTSAHELGKGFRVGVTVAAKLGVLNAFADIYTTDMSFAEGPAKGISSLTGLTLGFALR